MKSIYSVFAAAMIFTSCSQGESEPTVTYVEPVNPPVVVEDIQVPEQHNIVTPEFWQSYKTDISAIFYFSKIDSLQDHLLAEKLVMKTYADKNQVEYHEYYTNDNMGMVQLNDSLFFDLTEYLFKYQEGFVLLKPGGIETVGYEFLEPEDVQGHLEQFYQ